MKLSSIVGRLMWFSTILGGSCGVLAAEPPVEKPLLDAFHKFGVTKCDKYIVQNSNLKGNWDFFITKYPEQPDPKVNEASVVIVTGGPGDTAKMDDTYVQTKTSCYVHRRMTITFPVSCRESIDANNWTVSKVIQGRDYVQLTTKKGVTMYAKEISIGNQKSCIQEIELRNAYPLAK